MTKPDETTEESGADERPARKAEPTKPKPGTAPARTGETGGPKGPEPTRYGDWEKKGRCIDF